MGGAVGGIGGIGAVGAAGNSFIAGLVNHPLPAAYQALGAAGIDVKTTMPGMGVGKLKDLRPQCNGDAVDKQPTVGENNLLVSLRLVRRWPIHELCSGFGA